MGSRIMGHPQTRPEIPGSAQNKMGAKLRPVYSRAGIRVFFDNEPDRPKNDYKVSGMHPETGNRSFHCVLLGLAHAFNRLDETDFH